MNRGKIVFGKIGFNLGGFKAAEAAPPPPPTQTTHPDKDEVTGATSGFGSFGKASQENTSSTSESEGQGTGDMEAMMGFSGFGKKARDFNLDSLVEETRKSAVDRSRENIEKLKLQPSEAAHTDSAPPSESTSARSDADIDDDDDDEFIGPPLPPGEEPPKVHPESESESGEEEEEKEHWLPTSHELVLEHGTKTVCALAVDSSGTRLVSGGLDYDVRYWDFQGMDQSKEAFRSFCPADGYPINSVDYSCTGDKVLVVSGSQQAKVYDRDGIELFECARGDMYLHDMGQTKGHIGGLTCGVWHPRDKEEFATSCRDGTCRLWHTSRPGSQKNVIKARALNGLKTHPITCAYNRDGLLVACACDDGSIQMWDHRKSFVNVSINIKSAHAKGSDTSGLTFAYDNRGFATRGGDDTLKLWDIRNTKSSIHTKEGIFNRFPMTNCVFSPNDQMVMTGISLNKGETTGKLIVIDRNTWETVKEIEVGPSHVVKIIWHPRLKQVMIGCGDGKVRILYEPKVSRNGAVLVAARHKKRSKQAEVVVSQQVITPHALPMFREERHKSTRKLEERDRKDPVRSRQPDLPVGKAGSGGRVSAGGSTLSSYIIRNMGLRNKVHEEGDPREALLKYAKDAAENPYWVTPAYKRNQPQPIFQESDANIKEEEEEDEEEEEEEEEKPPTKKLKQQQ